VRKTSTGVHNTLPGGQFPSRFRVTRDVGMAWQHADNMRMHTYTHIHTHRTQNACATVTTPPRRIRPPLPTGLAVGMVHAGYLSSLLLALLVLSRAVSGDDVSVRVTGAPGACTPINRTSLCTGTDVCWRLVLAFAGQASTRWTTVNVLVPPLTPTPSLPGRTGRQDRTLAASFESSPTVPVANVTCLDESCDVVRGYGCTDAADCFEAAWLYGGLMQCAKVAVVPRRSLRRR